MCIVISALKVWISSARTGCLWSIILAHYEAMIIKRALLTPSYQPRKKVMICDPMCTLYNFEHVFLNFVNFLELRLYVFIVYLTFGGSFLYKAAVSSLCEINVRRACLPMLVAFLMFIISSVSCLRLPLAIANFLINGTAILTFPGPHFARFHNPP